MGCCYLRVATVPVSLLAAAATGQCPPATLMGIGSLPSGQDSWAQAVSADGTTVVGYASPGSRAFRWRAAEGMLDLGVLAGSSSSAAYAVSIDGSVVVGASAASPVQRAFRWTESGGMVSLSPASTWSVAFGVSGDGAIAVGLDGFSAVIWTAQGVSCINCAHGLSSARSVSLDGSVVAGLGSSVSNIPLWRWTSAGVEYLPTPPFGVSGPDRAVLSGDGGSVFVSLSLSGQSRLLRWRGSDLREIGLHPPLGQGILCSSGDGNLAAGYWGVHTSTSESRALLWTEALGPIDLDTALRVMGADLTGWTVQFATGVSAEGSTIVGYGRRVDPPSGPARTESWVATVPILLTVRPLERAGCLGGTETFRAAAVGSAGPFSFSWRKGGVPINPTSPRIELITAPDGRSSELRIHEVVLDDSGEYDCVVSSSAAPCHVITAPAALMLCYANCDCSSSEPNLNVADFSCFLTRYAAGEAYANCDGSTQPPVLNVADFSCFLTRYAAGCP